MKHKTYLEKIKPMLYAMTLDYSIVPKCVLEVLFSGGVFADNLRGKFFSGEIDTQITLETASAENNAGVETSGAVQCEIDTETITTEPHPAKDVEGIDAVVIDELIECATVERGWCNALKNALAQCVQTNEVAPSVHVGKNPTAFLEEDTEFSVGINTNKEHAIDIVQSNEFDFNVNLNVLRLALKEVMNAYAELVDEFAVCIEHPEAKSAVAEYDFVSDVIITANKHGAKRTAPNIAINIQPDVIVQRMRWARLEDYRGKTLKEVFENKTLKQACLVLI